MEEGREIREMPKRTFRHWSGRPDVAGAGEACHWRIIDQFFARAGGE
jgi:hypothetical protein